MIYVTTTLISRIVPDATLSGYHDALTVPDNNRYSGNTRKVPKAQRFYGILRYNICCHMATIMLQLPYGNEREIHDGRRTSTTSQSAWMESIQAHAQGQEVPLCPKVEARRDLYYSRIEVANTYDGRGSKENLLTRQIKNADPGRQKKLAASSPLSQSGQLPENEPCRRRLVFILPYVLICRQGSFGLNERGWR